MVTKVLRDLLFILCGSLIAAVGLYFFVYNASFAPSGVDGIATMVQAKLGWNAGLVSLAINAPLLILSLIFLDKKFAIYTILCSVFSSLFIVLFDVLNLEEFQYVSKHGSYILPAIFSGVFLGLRTALVFKVGGSSAGVDIIAALIQKKNPYVNFEKYIAIFCYMIIGVSFFVYDKSLESIMLSIIQIFVYEKTVEYSMRSLRHAMEFKIVTKNADSLKDEILSVLKHGATIVDGKGMFTDEGKSIIFCVVNLRQVPEFMKILKKHEDIFVYCSQVDGVNGNFRWNRKDIAK